MPQWGVALPRAAAGMATPPSRPSTATAKTKNFRIAEDLLHVPSVRDTPRQTPTTPDWRTRQGNICRRSCPREVPRGDRARIARRYRAGLAAVLGDQARRGQARGLAWIRMAWVVTMAGGGPRGRSKPNTPTGSPRGAAGWGG